MSWTRCVASNAAGTIVSRHSSLSTVLAGYQETVNRYKQLPLKGLDSRDAYCLKGLRIKLATFLMFTDRFQNG